jgi:hypothetical protein
VVRGFSIKPLSRAQSDEHYVLGYNAIQSVGSQPIFLRNIPPSSPELKNSKKPA